MKINFLQNYLQMKKTGIYIIILFFFSCQNIDIEKEKQSLITINKQFSDLSVQKGMQFAF